jgi:hypothetical protein
MLDFARPGVGGSTGANDAGARFHALTSGVPMPAEIHLFNCLKDNYGVLVHDPADGSTAAIDAPEAAAVENALRAKNWRLTSHGKDRSSRKGLASRGSTSTR